MRLGIRGKLVGTLMLAGLLPLLLSLAAGLTAFHQTQKRFVGQSFRAMARQQAEHLATLMAAQVDSFRLINQLPQSLQILAAADAKPELSAEQLQQIEARWPTLPANDPLLRSILDNELALRWQAIQRQRPRIAEVLITDRYGRLVAATNRTSDYYQADEPWWQQCWAKGEGRITLSDVTFDASVVSADGAQGAYVVDLCIPITMLNEDGSLQPPIGVMKVSVHVRWLLEQLRTLPPGSTVAELGQDVWLIGATGRPLVVDHSPFEQVPPELLQQIQSQVTGHMVSRDLKDHEVIGFARVIFTGRGLDAPRDWYVLVTARREVALATAWPTMWTILAAGSIVIGFCFVGGVWIARREIIRPLLELRRGARKLEEGKLNFRLKIPGEQGSVFRHDEVGELAAEFNRMASELERSIRALDHANLLKQQFIDLASHELRTPITYILGVTELAARQRHGTEEEALLTRIRSKAQRLNRIVENMFKLLHSGLFESTLSLGAVDLSQITLAAAAEVEPFVQARKQKLEVKVPPAMETVTADGEKLRDILDNLLTNAIRFSPDGADLELEILDHDETVEIAVRDRGPGIAEEDLPYIFEPFYPGHTPLAYHTSGEYEYMTRGIGLGLSVVKRFVEMHGGTVKAEPADHGTRFRVLLPKHPVVGGVVTVQ